MLNLKTLSAKVDKALEEETADSLYSYLERKRGIDDIISAYFPVKELLSLPEYVSVYILSNTYLNILDNKIGIVTEEYKQLYGLAVKAHILKNPVSFEIQNVGWLDEDIGLSALETMVNNNKIGLLSIKPYDMPESHIKLLKTCSNEWLASWMIK